MTREMEHRLTKNARSVLKKIEKSDNRQPLSKINALDLIQPLSEQKGSLGEIMMRGFMPNTQKFISKSRSRKLNIPMTSVLAKSFQLASSSNSPFVGTEHLFHALLLLITEKDSKTLDEMLSEPPAKLPVESFKKNKGMPGGGAGSGSEFFQDMSSIMENFFSPQGNKRNKKSYLNDFSSNLNEEIKKQDLVLVGRETELERISNILGRKNKNNPVLIGEPGVGKTAIVEGLAKKIAEGKAPFYLTSKKIFNIDLGLLVAGTNFRGEFEARLKEVINEAKNNEEVILFIDEIHNLVGAGNAIGGMDAANILKPALSRGEIQVIGATTVDEYRKHIEKDAALERRFQPILIEEPSKKEAGQILSGIKKSYEKYHRVSVEDNALEEAVSLAKKLFPDRFLPDSAIDLLDETAARIKSQTTDSNIYNKLTAKKQRLLEISEQKEDLVLADQYESAIKLRDKEKNLENQIKKLKAELRKKESANPTFLSIKNIRETAAASAQVSMDLLTQEKKDIPNKSKKLLKGNLVGQENAINKIYNTLLRQFAGIGHPDRPLGSFLFIGSSGIGKTMTAKLLSRAISPTGKQNLIQVNMSEFMERHSISRLLGAPAGYVGYEETSGFSDKIRRNPHSVVLFDEIEKADSSVLNILLQILEEGRITDAKGRNIDFRNCIVILTSNIGTNELNQISKIGFDSAGKKAKIEQEKKEAIANIREQLEEDLPLELINRLDHIIVFDFLKKKELQKITEKELQKLAARLKARGILAEFTPKTVEYIAKKSHDPKEGARLVRRKIETIIEPLIAQHLLKKKRKQKISVSLSRGKPALYEK